MKPILYLQEDDRYYSSIIVCNNVDILENIFTMEYGLSGKSTSGNLYWGPTSPHYDPVAWGCGDSSVLVKNHSVVFNSTLPIVYDIVLVKSKANTLKGFKKAVDKYKSKATKNPQP